MQLLDCRILRGLLWGAGSWNLKVVDNDRLRGVQRSMVRKMLNFQDKEGEGKPAFFARTERIISETIERYSHYWDMEVNKKVWALAGHMARMGNWDPTRISYRVFKWKNYEWIRKRQQTFGNQLHCRYLHIWRWERPIYKYLKAASWQQQADDVAGWNAQLHTFLDWRKVNR